MEKRRATKIALFVGAALVVLLLATGGCFYYRMRANFEEVVLRQQEGILREDLTRMRESIKQYAHDRHSQPQSLTDLVNAGYLPEMPRDPMTGKADWQLTQGQYQPSSSKPTTGIVDVHSASSKNSSVGTPYNQW
jgi:general secretion pathway protein G